jgi:hypothetical protein
MSSGSNSDYGQLQSLLNEMRSKATVIEHLTPRLQSIVEKMGASSPIASQRPGEYWKAAFLLQSLERVGLTDLLYQGDC